MSIIVKGDAGRLPLADRSVDLVFGSPPYADARWYGDRETHSRDCREWVNWMLDVTTDCQRVSRGPVIWVVGTVTRDRCYWPCYEGLSWLWWERGGECELYRPCIFHRVGVPGSGGKDWFRADFEFIMCFKRPGPLPWSDNKATGHPPKWGLGGEMSYRVSNGARVNQWGHPINSGATIGDVDHVTCKGKRPSHRERFRHDEDGNVKGGHERNICAIANPGNVIIEAETDLGRSLTTHKVGGGLMGSDLAHLNEAPFPETLAAVFIESLCHPGGTILDPFSGSGTTSAVAVKLGRKFVACDLRRSQCELTRRRIAEDVPLLATV